MPRAELLESNGASSKSNPISLGHRQRLLLVNPSRALSRHRSPPRSLSRSSRRRGRVAAAPGTMPRVRTGPSARRARRRNEEGVRCSTSRRWRSRPPRKAGADFADARAGIDETESLTVRNQEMEGIDRATSIGRRRARPGRRPLGVRGHLPAGRGGGRAHGRRSPSQIAKAAQRLPGDPVTLSPGRARGRLVARRRSQEDPFTVPLEEKVALLMEATRRMQAVPGVTFAEGGLDFFRRSTWFASTDGAAIDQVVMHSRRRDRGHRRSATATCSAARYPNSFRGHIKAAGYEHIRTLGLIEEAERIGREAVDLLAAPECPSEVTTLILDSGQMELQVHESIGHPIELDRVLGHGGGLRGLVVAHARATAGRCGTRATSSRSPPTRRCPAGSARSATTTRACPRRRTPIIVDGIFQNFLTNRETAPVVGQTSNGTSRADGWSHLPLIRMTNISIEPREGSLAEIIGDTEGRHLHDDEHVVVDRRQAHQLPVRLRDGVAHRRTASSPQMLQEPELHGDHAGVLGLVRRGGRPRGVGRVGHAELRQGPAGTGRAAWATARRPRGSATSRWGCADARD